MAAGDNNPRRSPETDAALVRRVGAGDSAAFETLFARHSAAVRRHLQRTLRDPEAAGDLVQDVFLRLWTHAAQWDGRGSFKGWLLRIATNQALNYLRAQRRRPQQPLELPADELTEDDDTRVPGWLIDRAALEPDVAAEHAERNAALRRLVAQLPEDKREVVRLIHDAEMETRAVAAALGIPEGTVKSRLHYATKRLARDWRATEDASEEPTR